MLQSVHTRKDLAKHLDQAVCDAANAQEQLIAVKALGSEGELAWTQSRVEELEARCMAIEKKKTSLERRIAILADRDELDRTSGSRVKGLMGADECTKDEGTLVEQYGSEVRTTFVRRGDGLRLRITNLKTNVLYDSFEKGREDCLHTYTAKGDSFFSLSFLAERDDSVVSYTRIHDGEQWCLKVAQSDDSRTKERAVTLLPGADPAPFSDTPSAFKAKVASVEILRAKGNHPVHFLKDILSRKGAVWQRRAADADADEEEEMCAYLLDEAGRLDRVEDSRVGRAEADSAWEEMLLAEADSVALVLAMERYFQLFVATHCSGEVADTVPPFQESQPLRFAALSQCIYELYTTLDDSDKKHALHAAEQAARIKQLEAEVAIHKFDPTLKI